MVTYDSLISRNDTIAVVGLGYVGLPLAVSLSKHFSVTGYDYKAERINQLISGIDKTLEVSKEDLTHAQINFTNDPENLSACRLIIIAVPTPINEHKIPDLMPLKSASQVTGQHMTEGSCIIFESTVFPGATQEVCLPILEQESGLKIGKNFTLGYSPERINPGDKVHTLEKILKIVSGSDSSTVDLLYDVYGTIIKAGIYKASSIMVAEAAKVIENTQRDLNIALMNELALIFDKMDIDTLDVLEAAGTKWNFLPFKPGLVGGHCIGVDPYYLTFKAESMGYHPEIILAGRRINDSMGKYIADRTVKILIKEDKQVRKTKVAILGLTFKENVPDLRNTKVVDIIYELKDFGIEVLVNDPLADKNEAKEYYGIDIISLDNFPDVDAVIIAVMHEQYLNMGILKIAGLCGKTTPIILDIKGGFKTNKAEIENMKYWRL